jgi:hypothetical protein
LRLIAERALKRDTGARALRAVTESCGKSRLSRSCCWGRTSENPRTSTGAKPVLFSFADDVAMGSFRQQRVLEEAHFRVSELKTRFRVGFDWVRFVDAVHVPKRSRPVLFGFQRAT